MNYNEIINAIKKRNYELVKRQLINLPEGDEKKFSVKNWKEIYSGVIEPIITNFCKQEDISEEYFKNKNKFSKKDWQKAFKMIFQPLLKNKSGLESQIGVEQ